MSMEKSINQGCRACGKPLKHVFVDLGNMPPSNAYLSSLQESQSEKTYPLRVFVCDKCWLVQTEDFVKAEALFNEDYAYFSSVSKGWLEHAKSYVSMITEKLSLTPASFVMEVASNDGYLLQNFVASGIPCVGIEPTMAVAEKAESIGVPVIREFFSQAFARQFIKTNRKADLIIGNNVLAHVPDINDFIAGLKLQLAPQGTITLEFPHLIELIDKNQFDTIYHEHFSYLSLTVVNALLSQHTLTVYHVERLPTHGGSLRLYVCHLGQYKVSAQVTQLLCEEAQIGVATLAYYQKFQTQVDKIKSAVISALQSFKNQELTVVGYGAAAKGNTLLNYCGVDKSLLPFICDAAPSKQGMYMPGSAIEIISPDKLVELKPDVIFILPWNIKEEIIEQLAYLKPCQFVTAIPELTFQ